MNHGVGPIKICLIAPKAYPLFNPRIKKIFGGAELDLYLLACELAQDPGYDVSFITADYGQADEEVINRVKVYKSLKLDACAIAGARRIWQAMKKADAEIYFQETASPGTFLVACFCQRMGREFIYRTAHLEECNGDYLKTHFLAGRGFRWAVRRAVRVIVQNQQDRAQLRNTIGVNSVVIRNAHPLRPLQSCKRDIILWSGRSASFKRPRLYLQLAKRTPDERFVMICQQATADSDYENLKKEAAAIANLEFISRVPFKEVGDYFHRAKICINTSESEGFANTFIDACKAGTPLLSLRVNPDNFIGDNDCGLCAEDDWDRFAEMFDRLRTDASAASRLGANGRKYVEDNHDIVEIVKVYKKLFEEIAAGHRGTVR